MKVIAELTAGFGNQMFSYACGYALAKRKGADFYINTYMADNGMSRPLEIDKLNITYKERITYLYRKDLMNRAVCNKIRRQKAIGWRTRIYKEKQHYTYDPQIFEVDYDVMLSGYWQTYRYFEAYRPELLSLFTPKQLSEKATQKIEDIRRIKNTVAVHIRRGDYLEVNAYIGPEYASDAMRIMEEKLGNVNYCFFSDDITWVKEYFGEKENHHFISGSTSLTDVEEFFCMVACEHHIIANSTFSWWGAYLNQNKEKIVIAPKVSIWGGDFYPKEWLTLESSLANTR
ncbi:MAG: alpha-1,2-fucosyltransferase [Clostridiales bacterium]|nr:alpha-1,2-fucosyltransferase [Clostridiales bacterium]